MHTYARSEHDNPDVQNDLDVFLIASRGEETRPDTYLGNYGIPRC